MLTDFTFIVPTFNRHASTARAIVSIATQAMLPREIIVVDDGSDQPFGYSGAGADLVRIIRHDSNKGAAAARNTGMRAATTGWISFLDSDDVLVPDTLQKRCAEIDPDDVLKIVGCAWVTVNNQGDARKTATVPERARRRDDHFAGIWFSPGSCIFMNAQAVLKKAGPLEESIRRLEDFEWFMRLSAAGFDYTCDDICGVAIRKSRGIDPVIVVESCRQIAALEAKRSRSSCQRRWMASYLAFERAAAFFYSRQYASFILSLAQSWVLKPRLGLYPVVRTRQRKLVSPPDLSTLMPR